MVSRGKADQDMELGQMMEQIEEVIAQGPFDATWDSLSKYRVPEWYKNAKFGIFIHWGIFSVPAFSNEWYSRNMYIVGSPEYKHHRNVYGPQNEFGYKDFIPMFQAEKFDAKEWAAIFEQAGAKYVVPVAEHHDGFQMYRSEISHWNAYEMGPKRDVLGELKKAVEEKGMRIGASSHRVEHWFFMGKGKEFDSDIKEPLKRGDFYWPSMAEKDHHDLFSTPTPTKEYLEDWLARTCEIVDRYHPKVIYFDWWIQHSSMKPYLQKFTAYYYNRAAEWGEEVVITYKHDAYMFGTAVVDMERGMFADVKPYFWQTDTSVALNSWCYTKNNQYRDPEGILCDLVDIVSKNGCLLLNIGPKANGTIPKEDREILYEIGDWLRVNGEAIYETTVWRLSGEGPTKVEEGQFTDGVKKEFTSHDIRYTVNGSHLYATVLRCDEKGLYALTALRESDASHKPNFHGIIDSIELLGFDTEVTWYRDRTALHIEAKGVQSTKPIVFKLTMR